MDRSPNRLAGSPLTVCIVTHRRPDLLRKLATELAWCELPSEFSGVIVVDNGGSPESDEIVKQAAPKLGMRLLRSVSGIKSAALNLALAQIPEGLVVFIDDDATPSRDWLIAYAEASARLPKECYFGGPVSVKYELPPPDWLLRFLPLSAIGSETCCVVRPQICGQFLGFNWGAYAKDLKRIGGFSTYFGPGTPRMGGDESFAQWHLRHAGIRAQFLEDAIVSHYVPQKNCSTEWLLARTVPTGVNAGIAHERRNRVAGKPLSCYRSIMRTVWRQTQSVDLWNLVTLQQPGRFWLKYWIAWSRGFLQGVTEGAIHDPLDPERWKDRGLGDNYPAHISTDVVRID